jgi:hypothetical protein
MAEQGGVEVQGQSPLRRPVHPPREVPGLDLVAIHRAPVRLGVHGVDVHAMASRRQVEREVDVGAQLVWGAGASGIAAGDGQPGARECGRTSLEARNVIALPAVHGERHFGG